MHYVQFVNNLPTVWNPITPFGSSFKLRDTDLCLFYVAPGEFSLTDKMEENDYASMG